MKLINKIKGILVKEEKKNYSIDEYTQQLLTKNTEMIAKMNSKIAG